MRLHQIRMLKGPLDQSVFPPAADGYLIRSYCPLDFNSPHQSIAPREGWPFVQGM